MPPQIKAFLEMCRDIEGIFARLRMTEQEWLTCTHPEPMLYYLFNAGNWEEPSAERTVQCWHDCVTERKLRLFACGCCREVWPLLTDDRSRRAVEVAERYADGEATMEALNTAFLEAYAVQGPNHQGPANAARQCAYFGTDSVALSCLFQLKGVVSPATQAALLRCVFGNPWRPVLGWNWNIGGKCHDMNWLSWNDRAVPRIARQIYDSRDWSGLGPLADALEEAGVESEEECRSCEGKGYNKIYCGYDAAFGHIHGRDSCLDCRGTGRAPNPLLAHLRGGGPHCRGCHVLDLLLGKS